MLEWLQHDLQKVPKVHVLYVHVLYVQLTPNDDESCTSGEGLDNAS